LGPGRAARPGGLILTRATLLRLARGGALVGLGLMGAAALTPVVRFDEPWSTVCWDRDGELLGGAIAADEQWRFPAQRAVPPRFAAAIVLAEDRRYYWHPGVDPLAIARAFAQDLRAGEVVSGGSTLTMQVVRMSRGNPPRTVLEKLREAPLALRLELSTTKPEVLALYAAHAPFGGNTVGLEAAAWRYFGRPPESLTWAEAAVLAVLPNNPALLHPGRHRAALQAKRDRLLRALQAAGELSEADLALALAEPLPSGPRPVPQLAPHLMMTAHARAPDAWRFDSTVDVRLQARVADVTRRHHEQLALAEVHNLAVLVADVRTGEVLAYVGNAPITEQGLHSEHVDVIRAPRSTGSLLKPFLYASMLETGELLPHELVPDVPMRLGGFAPENFDHAYLGALPASRALARSRNVPATWMLRSFGVDRFYARLERLGLTTLSRPAADYGLALILGGAEGTLWDLTEAYRQLALAGDGQTGVVPALHTDRSEAPATRPVAVDAGAAWLTITALEEVARPGVDSAWRSFNSSRRVAWKTGTSQGFRDAWAIGFTPDYVVGVWVGNADGEGRPGLTGISAAAPVLFDVFDLLPRSAWFEEPSAALHDVKVCAASGQRAGPDCAEAVTERVPAVAVSGPPCSYCRRVHCDAACQHRVHAGCVTLPPGEGEPWFALPADQAWYYARVQSGYRPLPPWAPGCEPLDHDGGPLACVVPREGSEVFLPRDLDGARGALALLATHRAERATVDWHLDRTYLGRTVATHELTVQPDDGDHVLTLVDGEGNRVTRHFRVSSAESEPLAR